MSQVDHTLSLTPPAHMNRLERIGAFITGLGLLAMVIAFLSNRAVSPWLVMGFAGTFFATGGILRSIDQTRWKQLTQILFGAGVLALVFLGFKLPIPNEVMLVLVFGATSIGSLIYFKGAFGTGPAGIKNNGTFQSEATRQGGVLSWMLAIVFTGFYIALYWFPDELYGLAAASDPLYYAITGKHSVANGHVLNQWFLYGLIYTLAVIVMGARYIYKYRHNRYQVIRTISVAFFQLVFAFAIPHVMERLNHDQAKAFSPVVKAYQPTYDAYAKAAKTYSATQDSIKKAGEKGYDKAALQASLPARKAEFEAARDAAAAFTPQLLEKSPKVTSHYFSYFWPLDYDMLWGDHIESYIGGEPKDGVHVAYFSKDPVSGKKVYGISSALGFGSYGWLIVLFAAFMSTVGVVVLTYYFGKRWYCSWVCGCGGLAETAGDPFRHQSDKSLKAWRIERITIYSVLALVSLITVLMLVDWLVVDFLGDFKSPMKKGYGFLIGMMFAGVVGTGFYPILGSRVWCRFGCPQAAVLGILQKYFSRFHITTNGDQCISCGNCSTYCEMGIDVKWYAQRGQNIIRASCVGCGVCSAVCPRGVLNLENGPSDKRYNDLSPISISAEDIQVKV